MESSKPVVVVVGGGFGGLDAARGLKHAPVQVTLVDRRNHHVFQPLLYQVATAALSPGDIAAPIRWILRKQHNVRVLLAEVQAIDIAAKRLKLDGGHDLAYDYLILATGATHSYFGHGEWQRFAPGLKTIEDALEVRRRMLLAFERAERETDPALQRQYLTFAVVGGGPTGVELAGALAEIAKQTLRDEFNNIEPEVARIVLLEAGPSILPAFPEKLRDASRRMLRSLGVEVWENTMVTGIEAGVVHLGADRLAARTVMWAAGVTASPLGTLLDVPVDRSGRVIVEKDLSMPGHPEVFVIGDLALFTHQTGQPLPGVAQVAMQGGKSAAQNIVRLVRGESTQPFHYRDLGNMATIGRARAIADLPWMRLSGFVAWVIWLFIHLVSLIGFRNKLLVLISWMASYITYQRGVRLITGKDVERTEKNVSAPS